MLTFLCVCITHSQHCKMRKNNNLNFKIVERVDFLAGDQKSEITPFHLPDWPGAQKVTTLKATGLNDHYMINMVGKAKDWH